MKAILPWLSLNEAALLVAERLMNERRQGDTAGAPSLDEARGELLGWAYRGQLEVQGRFWSIPGPDEPEEFPDQEGWVAINASRWDPSRLLNATKESDLQPAPSTANADDKPAIVSLDTIFAIQATPSPCCNDGSPLPGTYMVVDWEKNVLTIEGTDIYEPYGYSELRVRRVDLEGILPIVHSSTEGMVVSGTPTELINRPRSKNSGGAPRKFADDLLIEIIKIANGIDGLPEDKQDLVRQLRACYLPSWGDDLPSGSTIQRIVDMVYKRIFPRT
jgi:hypothetical protein